MNRKKNFILLLLFLLTGGMTSLTAQNKQEKKRLQKEAVIRLIESNNYKIDVKTAMPMSGRSVSLNPYFSLEIKNDSVFSYLPYYGRAYSIPYNGGDGLHFSAPLQTYSRNRTSKDDYEIHFVARNQEDRYEFSVDLYTNGSAHIHVNMQNRQSISYYGNIDLERNKDKDKGKR